MWNLDLSASYADTLDVLGFIDPDVRAWAEQTSRVPDVLQTRSRAT